MRPDFQITDGNAGAISTLCERLEGIRPALELAAARAQVLTPARMLEQMQSRFGFLVSRRRDVAERHRTLRAALDWSHDLLRPELQRFFTRLSVFRGGWSPEAAEIVCEEPQALEYLEELRECSMASTEPSEAPEGQTRFRMLETVREYGLERLPEDALSPLRERHARYYLAMDQEAEPELRTQRQAYWFPRLTAEHDNLRAALSWFSDSEEGTSNGLALSAALARFWITRGHAREGRAWVTRFLSRTEHGPGIRAHWLEQPLPGGVAR